MKGIYRWAHHFSTGLHARGVGGIVSSGSTLRRRDTATVQDLDAMTV